MKSKIHKPKQYSYIVSTTSRDTSNYKNKWEKWGTRISLLAIVAMLLFEFVAILYLSLTGRVNFWTTPISTWFTSARRDFGWPFADLLLDVLMLIICIPLLISIWNKDIFQNNFEGGIIKFLLYFLGLASMYYLVTVLLPGKIII